MIILKSFKITPNIISRYKSSYLLKITEFKSEDGSWFLYTFQKFYNTHLLEPLGVVANDHADDHANDPDIINFDNNQTLVRKTIDSATVYYYGSLDLPFNIRVLIPIEEKLPNDISILEIQKAFEKIRTLPYFQAVY